MIHEGAPASPAASGRNARPTSRKNPLMKLERPFYGGIHPTAPARGRILLCHDRAKKTSSPSRGRHMGAASLPKLCIDFNSGEAI
jgi:hypothetical protein